MLLCYTYSARDIGTLLLCILRRSSFYVVHVYIGITYAYYIVYIYIQERCAERISYAAWTIFVTPQWWTFFYFFYTSLYTRYAHDSVCALCTCPCVCVWNTAQFYVIKIIGRAVRGRRRRFRRGSDGSRGGVRLGAGDGGAAAAVVYSRRRPREPPLDEGETASGRPFPSLHFYGPLFLVTEGNENMNLPRSRATDGFADVSYASRYTFIYKYIYPYTILYTCSFSKYFCFY